MSKINKNNIYLDYASTSPVDKRVLEAMMPFFDEKFGNAASVHRWGKESRQAVEEARNQIGKLLNAPANRLFFTSGATEAINAVLKGIALRFLSEGCHIITCATEHKAVLDTCAYLEEIGVEISYLPVDKQGNIDLEMLEASIQEQTRLVALMWVNNETGVIHPIEKIAKLCQSKEIPLFVDATQAVGKLPINILNLGIDMLCCSAHKFYGPKGVGALYIREGIALDPLIHGGGHEQGYRSGTLNVAGIVGMGQAANIAQQALEEESERLIKLRILLEEKLLAISPNITINGAFAQRAPHIASIIFKGKDGRILMELLPELAISHGSACTSAMIEPSHVLQAMRFSDEEALATLRFSLGRFNTEQEILEAVEMISSYL